MTYYCFFFFFSSRRRHTRSCLVSWARRCVQETGINAEYMGQNPDQNSQVHKLLIQNVHKKDHLMEKNDLSTGIPINLNKDDQSQLKQENKKIDNSQKVTQQPLQQQQQQSQEEKQFQSALLPQQGFQQQLHQENGQNSQQQSLEIVDMKNILKDIENCLNFQMNEKGNVSISKKSNENITQSSVDKQKSQQEMARKILNESLDNFFQEICTFKKTTKEKLKVYKLNSRQLEVNQKNYIDILVNDVKSKLNYIEIYKLDIQKLRSINPEQSTLIKFLQQQKSHIDYQKNEINNSIQTISSFIK
eukprot:TRINITY_DN1196_c0_g1_i2.p1 TRINITY_DN1196_c0_g1~~TRINITY_DN1196_c0_g1_i2.p1  ORF type:complete len:303 (+),score=78.32 TRINITY_DN1196_c0_g1_i2:56-964(+)